MDGASPPVFIISERPTNDVDDDDELAVAGAAVAVAVACEGDCGKQLEDTDDCRRVVLSRFISSFSLRRFSFSRADNDGCDDGDLILDHSEDDVEALVVPSTDVDQEGKEKAGQATIGRLVRNRDNKGLDERGWGGLERCSVSLCAPLSLLLLMAVMLLLVFFFILSLLVL